MLEWSNGLLEWSNGLLEWSNGLLEWSNALLEWSNALLVWSNGLLEWSNGLLASLVHVVTLTEPQLSSHLLHFLPGNDQGSGTGNNIFRFTSLIKELLRQVITA